MSNSVPKFNIAQNEANQASFFFFSCSDIIQKVGIINLKPPLKVGLGPGGHLLNDSISRPCTKFGTGSI